MRKFSTVLLLIMCTCFIKSQNYIKTNIWQDTTLMNDSKVDGLIYIKKIMNILLITILY